LSIFDPFIHKFSAPSSSDGFPWSFLDYLHVMQKVAVDCVCAVAAAREKRLNVRERMTEERMARWCCHTTILYAVFVLVLYYCILTVLII